MKLLNYKKLIMIIFMVILVISVIAPLSFVSANTTGDVNDLLNTRISQDNDFSIILPDESIENPEENTENIENTVNNPSQGISNITFILGLVPRHIELDIPEIEYKQVPQIIEKKMKEILKELDIDLQKYTFKIAVNIVNNIEQIYEATFSLYKDNKFIENKTIKLTYSNTKKKNITDEEYVKNIKIQKANYFVKNYEDKNYNINNEKTKYYTKLIKDDSVKIMFIDGYSSSTESLTQYSDTVLLLFKNGILYERRNLGRDMAITEFKVPNNIEENKQKDYVINCFEKQWNGENPTDADIEVYNVNIEKGTDKNITNGYTLTYNKRGLAEKMSDYIIITKDTSTNNKPDIDENKDIELIDSATKIKINAKSGVLPKDTKITVEKLTQGEKFNIAKRALNEIVSKMYVYDINLQLNNEKVQPTGKVKVSIPLPKDFDNTKIVIYKVLDDGNKIGYNITVKDGYVLFEADSFSTYVLGEKSTSMPNGNGEKKEETDTTIYNGKKLPQTGETNNIILLALIVNIAIGIVLKIKKSK